eukprot:3713514-Amphidinium_carterae.1
MLVMDFKTTMCHHGFLRHHQFGHCPKWSSLNSNMCINHHGIVEVLDDYYYLFFKLCSHSSWLSAKTSLWRMQVMRAWIWVQNCELERRATLQRHIVTTVIPGPHLAYSP